MNDFNKGYILGFLVAIVCMIICAGIHDLLENAEKNYDATTAHVITQQEETKN